MSARDECIAFFREEISYMSALNGNLVVFYVRLPLHAKLLEKHFTV